MRIISRRSDWKIGVQHSEIEHRPGDESNAPFPQFEVMRLRQRGCPQDFGYTLSQSRAFPVSRWLGHCQGATKARGTISQVFAPRASRDSSSRQNLRSGAVNSSMARPYQAAMLSVHTHHAHGGSVPASPGMMASLDRGHPLDGATRGYFEPRFSHDFSRVRVHTNAEAAASARSVRAHAFTVGHDIAFASGRYMPGTPAGKRLLGHELAHVVQSGKATQAAEMVNRFPADLPFELDEDQRREFEIYEYQSYLNQNGDIEGMPASGFMALALARRRTRGEWLLLPENGDALLVIEMLHIAPSQEQRNAALTLLRQMETSELQNMLTRQPGSSPGKINLWELAGKFEGIQLLLVLDILSSRFQGGFDELLRGRGPLKPVQSSELENRTLDWLKNKRKTAEEYFDQVWRSHRVVQLGETHHRGAQQRRFAAAMIRRHGGPGVTLALETKHQGPIDSYLKSMDRKKEPRLPEWFFEGGYHELLDAARATRTQVRAVDIAMASDVNKPLESLDPERDLNMAAVIGVAQAQGNKVLFLGGAMHVREARGHHSTPLGWWLADAGGESAYSIVMEFEDTATNQFFSKLQQEFPAMASIGFDVDESPLRWARDPDIPEPTSRGKNLDGYIYFLKPPA